MTDECDDGPVMRPIKNAFYERALVIAAQLQEEVGAGRMSHEDAQQRLVGVMSQPEMMKAVIQAAQAPKVTH